MKKTKIDDKRNTFNKVKLNIIFLFLKSNAFRNS